MNPFSIPLAEWNRFWFRTDWKIPHQAIRLGLGIAALVTFAAHILFANDWLGTEGWLNPTAGLYLVGQGIEGTGAEFRWSLFYAYPALLIPACWIGVAASIAIGLGLAPRVAAVVAIAILVMIHHRAPLLIGRGEPLLVPFLLYSLLLPVRGTVFPSNTKGSEQVAGPLWRCELATLGFRLMQVHFVLWILFSFTSMLGNEGWWTGEAVRQLLVDGQGWLPVSAATVTLAEYIAHVVILVQLLFLFTILHPAYRSLGFIAFFLFLAAALLVIGDWQYVIILAGLSIPLWFEGRFRSPGSIPV
ncbi:hypothetical protein SH501x_000730 [Pirellulaceae bacterium SH501]